MRYAKPRKREIREYVSTDYLLDLIRGDQPISTEEAAKQAARRIISKTRKGRANNIKVT